MGSKKSGNQSTVNALLGVEEAAVLLGVDRATCYRAIRSDTFPLPVVRLGGRIRVPRGAVERLIDGTGAGIEKATDQLASASGSRQNCGTPSAPSSSVPPRRRPTCSAARRSSAAITSV